ncbi:MAG: Gfo/Idh/MocA family protein [Planctomycetota bacterium]|jgi:predicted dehydrogenase
MKRRAFLKHTAGCALGAACFPHVVPSSALGKAGTVAASERITVGCIGVGSHGTSMNLKSYLAQKDAQVVAVCDVDQRHLRRGRDMVYQKYGNQDCTAYKDWRDIIARSDIDAVMISTPDHWHVPMSIAAIKAGKDVQCEKPTLTIQEGRVLSDTVKRYGAVFQTSTEDRAISIYHRMAELVRNGRIGKLHTIRVELPQGHSIQKAHGGLTGPKPPDWFDYDMWLGPAPEAPYHPGRCHWNFRWILDYSGGQLTDWGTHLLDTAQWGSDTERTGPVEIEGHGDFGNDKLYNTAKSYHIEYTYANGVRLIVDSGVPSIRFEGTEGWVGNRGWRGPLQAEPASLLDEQIGPEEIHLFTCPGGEHRNFLDCVKSRRDPYFPAEIGHRCSSVCHLGNIAMLTGRKLKWDPVKEEFSNDIEANRMRSRAMRNPWHLL